MNPLAALGIVIGILVFFIAYVFVGQPALHIAAWVVVAGVATFFAAGGGTAGLTKQIAGTFAGGFWVAVALAIWNAVAPGNILALSVILAIAAFILCVEAALPPLAFVPASFLGGDVDRGERCRPIRARATDGVRRTRGRPRSRPALADGDRSPC